MKTSPDLTDADNADSDLTDARPAGAGGTLRADGVWAWALPRGPGCAREARRLLGDALASLGVPRGAVGDAQLMVSELATNAHQHAADHGPHELWVCTGAYGCPPRDEDDRAAAGEVRCAIFDAYADARLPGYSWTSGDCGRGLSIVRELSGGRWGLLRARGRLGSMARGKAVWFAVQGASGSTSSP